MSPVSSYSVSEGEGADMSSPSGTEIAEQRRATETNTPAPADPGTDKGSTFSVKKGEIWKQNLRPVKQRSRQGERNKKTPAL